MWQCSDFWGQEGIRELNGNEEKMKLKEKWIKHNFHLSIVSLELASKQ